VIDESDLQYEKHFDPRILTLFGIKIDWSDEDDNAWDSIRVKCEFNSKTIDIRLWLRFKSTIEFGTQNRKISKLFCLESVTVFINPSLTTTRRS
jgi:hypothetical protein